MRGHITSLAQKRESALPKDVICADGYFRSHFRSDPPLAGRALPRKSVETDSALRGEQRDMTRRGRGKQTGKMRNKEGIHGAGWMGSLSVDYGDLLGSIKGRAFWP